MYAKGPILDAEITDIEGGGQKFSSAKILGPVIRVVLIGAAEKPMANRPEDTKLPPNFYFVKDISKRFTKEALERAKQEENERTKKMHDDRLAERQKEYDAQIAYWDQRTADRTRALAAPSNEVVRQAARSKKTPKLVIKPPVHDPVPPQAAANPAALSPKKTNELAANPSKNNTIAEYKTRIIMTHDESSLFKY